MLLCASVLAISFAVPATAADAGTASNSNNSSSKSNSGSSSSSDPNDFIIENGVLTEYDGAGGNITIPAGVTGIDDEVFEDNIDITGVDFSKCALTSIGKSAFYDTGLTTVTIPSTVKSIGDNAFADCAGLKSITAAAGNSCYESDGGVLFDKGKTKLIQYPVALSAASYTVPASVKSICTSAFEECAKIKTVDLSKCALTSVGDFAFGSTGLTSVAVPATVVSIGESAFGNCGNLTAINVSGDNKNYMSDSFGVLFDKSETELMQFPAGNIKCTAYTIPKAVKTIGVNAFYGCAGIKSVEFQADTANKVTKIGDGAFFGCTGLSDIAVPEGVTAIGDYAFSSAGLKTVSFSNSVASIGDSAFLNCTNLTGINVDSGNANYKSENGVLFNSDKSELIQYPVGNKAASYSIPVSVTYIGDYAFYGGTYLASVIFPDDKASKVNNIGAGAFYYCTALTSVAIPKSVTSVGNYAFNSCTALTSVIIPNGVARIGYYAFGSTGLASVAIPASVQTIGMGTFGLCTNLKSITVDSGNADYKSDSGVLFDKDETTLIKFPIKSEITSYTVPKSVTVIADGAFNSCADLNSVIIPSGVKSIGTTVFYHCADLASVTIPDSVAAIGYEAFTGCVGATVYCHKGSYAETFAKSSGIHTADSSLKAITAFSINTVKGKINDAKHTVTLTLPKGTNAAALSPKIKVSGGAAVKPTSAAAINFTKPVKYTVTAKDGTKQYYTVTVSVIPSLVSVIYNAYEGSNWLPSVKDGAQAGTQGKKLSVQALKVKLAGKNLGGASVIYQVYVHNNGWQTSVSNGAMAGTTGLTLGIEALRVTLKGLNGYSVQYRVHAEGKSWAAWKTTKNNAAVGSAAVAGGKSTKIEAVEIAVRKIK